MILVTGGTGLVGSHLLYALTSSGKRVRALKRTHSDLSIVKKVFSFYTPQYESLFKSIEWIEGDILDIASLQEALNGVEYVYHAAAYISFDPNDKDLLIKTNTEGTANVVNVCLDAGIKKICHVSSIATMGHSINADVTEQTTWKTGAKNSNYARSKYLAEQEVWRASAEGLNVIIVNPTLIMGPHNWNYGTCRMFKEVGMGLRFYPPGSNGYVDVRDVVKAMILLMESNIQAQRFIINGSNQSFQHVFSLIANALNKKAPAIKASGWMLELAWRLEKFRSAISGRSPLITRESTRAAMRDTSYSSEKLQQNISLRFTPIKETIDYTSAHFRST